MSCLDRSLEHVRPKTPGSEEEEAEGSIPHRSEKSRPIWFDSVELRACVSLDRLEPLLWGLQTRSWASSRCCVRNREYSVKKGQLENGQARDFENPLLRIRKRMR